MREIKFRAWDTSSKAWAANDLMMTIVGRVSSNPDHMVLCQFTGLKDKNGKEIYEGDIVKTPAGVLTVQYIEHGMSFCFIKYANDEDSESYRLDSRERQNIAPDKRLELFEVIGNIYENPELLKA